ncbi:MAG: glutamine--tRNA ligase [Rhodospirillaceae bacterium]|nr:glutamine--tRNA ligase [Rhodospirillaceae bacterium]
MIEKNSDNDNPSKVHRDFLREQIDCDLSSGAIETVVTRFPPEPNGFLHIGHAKSIQINFGIAQEYRGKCNLRFDDTNPSKEEKQFIEAIKRDVEWLGFLWNGEVKYTSDHFEYLFELACHLITSNNAFVDDSSADEIRNSRGTLTEPGKQSPYRDRTVEENLDLFKRMRAGEFKDGTRVLRAKIDMTSGNINLRDPVLYRIMHTSHPRTIDKWCIYPTYDFAHGQIDAVEGITHSLCTLEFSDHRPLYEWLVHKLPLPSQPKQYEFSRLNISHTVLSKRRLTSLVKGKHVSGWDDPRMPTIAGLRRRGVPPEAIRNFINNLSISKTEGMVEHAMLDHAIRENLNKHALRRMGVLRPLKVIIENYPQDKIEKVEVSNHPANPEIGSRMVSFGREIWIEQDDFLEDPPRKFFRLGLGREVRLRGAYLITCKEIKKTSDGQIVELRCSYDPDSRGGNAPDGRKVRGTLHWVSSNNSVDTEVRLYEPLFKTDKPKMGEDFLEELNPNSCKTLKLCKIEKAVFDSSHNDPAIQLERLGYFCIDKDSTADLPILNRTIALRDSWTKINK